MQLLRLLLPLVFAANSVANAQDGLTAEQAEFFEAKIRPALFDYCYRCHSAEEKIKGGLTVDTRDGLIFGGDSGPAIVPGDLEGSLLWTAITWADGEYEMPPKEKMPAHVIADFQKWILMGAPDPRVTEKEVVETEIDVEAGKLFWSFRKPEKATPPATNDTEWAETAIDQFVLAKLEEKELEPAGEANPDALLRRLHFDLIGLPPSPEECSAFLDSWAQDPETAITSKLDELLASPHFGERWGRHWLDVARYAESTGKEVNVLFPEAWRYRDYVIDSFNADKPYDEFLKEQIAGDLLPIRNDADWQENLIATGFLALGTKGLNEQNPRQFAMDLVDEQIDATTQAILGLTVACARCHDHKSDPIPTQDYYAMAGIFLSTETFYGTTAAIVNRRPFELLVLPVADQNPGQSIGANELAQLKSRLADLESEQAELRAQAIRERLQQRNGMSSMEPAANLVQNNIRLNNQINQLRSRINGFHGNGVPKTFGMGVQERETPVNAPVLVRGEVNKPAQKVERGFLQVLDHVPAGEISPAASGRLELAEWLSSRENPLTARVMVNRIWQKLFGAGLVPTPDNFGATGQPPSHPELLDYLAVRFVENEFSIKAMIRELVLTRTYQMSTEFDSENYEFDPENHYLWRATPRRLDAEVLRDSMLVASGQLDRERPHASAVKQLQNSLRAFRFDPGQLDQSVNYRSVYLPVVRDSLPESLALFDAADPTIVSGSRESTNVPSQALYLMNNPFVIQQAEFMARRLMNEAKTPRERFARAFMIAFGRNPTPAEIESSMEFFQAFMPQAQEQAGSRDQARFLTFSSFCQGLLASAEFRFLN